MKIFISRIAALVVLAGFSVAYGESLTTTRGSMLAAIEDGVPADAPKHVAITMDGVFKSINYAARTAQVEWSTGRVTTVYVRRDNPRFKYNKVGDEVHVTIDRPVIETIKKVDRDLTPESVLGEKVTEPDRVKQAGRTIERTIRFVARVASIDEAAGMIVMRNQQRSVDAFVPNRNMLTGIANGDHVEATFAERIVMEVVHKSPSSQTSQASTPAK